MGVDKTCVPAISIATDIVYVNEWMDFEHACTVVESVSTGLLDVQLCMLGLRQSSMYKALLHACAVRTHMLQDQLPVFISGVAS